MRQKSKRTALERERQNGICTSSCSYRIFAVRRLQQDQGVCSQGQGAGHGQRGNHRPWCYVRRDRFYRAAREAGIKPILGCEVYVAPNSRFDKELTGGEERYHHLVLLAENNTGYANLMKIVSRGFTEGYYYKPRVDMEVLQEFHEGIIALSACLAGEVPRFILKGMKDEARKAARKYEACFGKGNYFLELQDHGIPEQRTVNMELLQMSRELDIPLVTTNDVHYTYAEDAIPHDILLCLQTGKSWRTRIACVMRAVSITSRAKRK